MPVGGRRGLGDWEGGERRVVGGRSASWSGGGTWGKITTSGPRPIRAAGRQQVEQGRFGGSAAGTGVPRAKLDPRAGDRKKSGRGGDGAQRNGFSVPGWGWLPPGPGGKVPVGGRSASWWAKILRDICGVGRLAGEARGGAFWCKISSFSSHCRVPRAQTPHPGGREQVVPRCPVHFPGGVPIYISDPSYHLPPWVIPTVRHEAESMQLSPLSRFRVRTDRSSAN